MNTHQTIAVNFSPDFTYLLISFFSRKHLHRILYREEYQVIQPAALFSILCCRHDRILQNALLMRIVQPGIDPPILLFFPDAIRYISTAPLPAPWHRKLCEDTARLPALIKRPALPHIISLVFQRRIIRGIGNFLLIIKDLSGQPAFFEPATIPFPACRI